MSRKRADRYPMRKMQAKERQEAWAALAPFTQLTHLDLRLGVGVGAVRQRARILKKVEKDKVKS